MSTGAQAVVDAGGAATARIMHRVERRMTELATGHGPVLARYAGDKLFARAAVAVELVPGAPLVHDDVLDGSALRRGRPTVVATGGREAATATGDLLFSRAFAELARRRAPAAAR